jgi:hypothetical protein
MATARRRRPWVLVFAVVGALYLGAVGACNGWLTVAFYQDSFDPVLMGQGIADDADRAAIVGTFRTYVDALDAVKARGWPLAVATLLLGGAVFVAAVRTLRGSAGARAALVQLIIAQACATAANIWLVRDVFDVPVRALEMMQAIKVHEEAPDRPRAAFPPATDLATRRAEAQLALNFSSIASALVVLGLTRRRSREFFEVPAKVVQGG